MDLEKRLMYVVKELEDINNPSEEVQLEAVKQNGYAIRFIENPTQKVKEYIENNYLTY